MPEEEVLQVGGKLRAVRGRGKGRHAVAYSKIDQNSETNSEEKSLSYLSYILNRKNCMIALAPAVCILVFILFIFLPSDSSEKNCSCATKLGVDCIANETISDAPIVVVPFEVPNDLLQKEGQAVCSNKVELHCNNATELKLFRHWARAYDPSKKSDGTPEDHLESVNAVAIKIKLKGSLLVLEISERHDLSNCTYEVEGKYIFFYIRRWNGIFAHYLIDHVPQVMYFAQKYPYHILIMPASKIGKAIWDTLGMMHRIRWLEAGNTLCTSRSGYIKAETERISWIYENAIRTLQPMITLHTFKERRTILYLSRAGSGNANGRALPLPHEKKLLSTMRKKIRKYDRKEELISVHGGDLTMQEQMELFRSASFIIGPHGGAFANLIWTERRPCSERVKILEFVCGTRSKEVQASCPYYKSYWRIYRGLSSVEYHTILFTKESNSSITFVDLDEFEIAIDELFAR